MKGAVRSINEAHNLLDLEVCERVILHMKYGYGGSFISMSKIGVKRPLFPTVLFRYPIIRIVRLDRKLCCVRAVEPRLDAGPIDSAVMDSSQLVIVRSSSVMLTVKMLSESGEVLT